MMCKISFVMISENIAGVISNHCGYFGEYDISRFVTGLILRGFNRSVTKITIAFSTDVDIKIR